MKYILYKDPFKEKLGTFYFHMLNTYNKVAIGKRASKNAINLYNEIIFFR